MLLRFWKNGLFDVLLSALPFSISMTLEFEVDIKFSKAFVCFCGEECMPSDLCM